MAYAAVSKAFIGDRIDGMNVIQARASEDPGDEINEPSSCSRIELETRIVAEPEKAYELSTYISKCRFDAGSPRDSLGTTAILSADRFLIAVRAL